MRNFGSSLLVSSKWLYLWNSGKKSPLKKKKIANSTSLWSSLEAWILRFGSFVKAILRILRGSDLLQSHGQRIGKDRDLWVMARRAANWHDCLELRKNHLSSCILLPSQILGSLNLPDTTLKPLQCALSSISFKKSCNVDILSPF